MHQTTTGPSLVNLCFFVNEVGVSLPKIQIDTKEVPEAEVLSPITPHPPSLTKTCFKGSSEVGG